MIRHYRRPSQRIHGQDEVAMNASEFYKLSFTCGMNQRYYQDMVAYWDFWDKAIAIAIAILALIAMLLAIWAYLKPNTQCFSWPRLHWISADWLSPVAAIVTLALAMILNITPTTTKLGFNSQMFQ